MRVGRVAALLVVVVVVVVIGSVALHRGPAAAPPQAGAPVPSVTSAAPTATPSARVSTTPSALPSPSPSPARSLSGRPLAQAWLTGYLDRSSRDDKSWVDAIREITDPVRRMSLPPSAPKWVV